MKRISKILREQVFAKNSPLYLPKERAAYFPSEDKIIDAVSMLKDALLVYPAFEQNTETIITSASKILKKEIKKTFCLFCDGAKHDCSLCKKKAAQITADFMADLPGIQALMLTDVRAAFNGDPAAEDPYEIILSYPGFTAIAYQRLAHYLFKKGVRVIPRIITEYAHSLTGADIHPGAEIGASFFIDHATGVVIGGTSVIGSNVKIYQGVTLGAKSFPLDKNGNPVKGIKRHPNVGDNVIIYANATILGDINIGSGVVIGANQTILTDVKKGMKIK